MRKKAIALIILYSLALGVAISLTMNLHYLGIWGGPEQNYLIINAQAMLRGLLIAIPVFGIVFLLHIASERFAFQASAPSSGRRFIGSGRFFLMIWGILLVCWLPFLLSFYPGGIVGDGAETLECSLGMRDVDSLFGLTQIYVLRLFLMMGKWFSQDINTGIFLYALFSMMLYAGACALAVTELGRRGVPPVLLLLCCALYAFSGHYATYSICLWKDGLFGAGILTLAVLLWREPEKEESKKTWAVSIVFVLLFLCFWRNMISIALLAAGVLLFLIRRRKNLLAMLMVLVSVFAMFIQGPVLRWAGINEARSYEALSVPLQQTAAAINKGAELTPEQEEVLWHIMPKEDWIAYYRPATCDLLKLHMDREYVRTHTFTFLRVWLELMPKYIPTYIRAQMMETLGFWQPYGSNKGFYYDWYTGVEDTYNRGYQEQDLIYSGTGMTVKPGLRSRLEYIPSGSVVWIMLLSVILVLAKKKNRKKQIKVLFPFVLCWMVVMFSTPMAYSYRYVEMLAMTVPLFLMMPFIQEADRKEEAIETSAGNKTHRSGVLYTILCSKTAAAIVSCMMILILLTVTFQGSHRIGKMNNGSLMIPVCGPGDVSEYYVTEGLYDNEQKHRWTKDDRVTVDFIADHELKNLDVCINVVGTIQGLQRYSIVDETGNEISKGMVDRGEQIRFEMMPAGRHVHFTMMLEDEMIVSDVLPVDDNRVVSMQIDWIRITETESLEV